MTTANLRAAVIHADHWAITPHLPANYKVLGQVDEMTFIAGSDEGEFTLDGYILPRLGMYTGHEIPVPEWVRAFRLRGTST